MFRSGYGDLPAPSRPQPAFREPPKISISITKTCNLRCAHCYGDCTPAPSPRELGRQEWLDFIDYLVAHDFIQLYIEGGEPFHRADFLDVLRHAAPRMMTLVRTHGTLIDKPMARTLKRIGVGRVFVDVMAARAETHDALTGVPGSFEKSCAAVRHLAAAGVKADMLIILHRKNAGEINDYLKLARDLGALRVGLLRLYPLGRAKRLWSELALSLDEQMAVIGALDPPPGLQVMQSWHPQDRNCCWQAATVDAFGNSIGCTYLREYVNFGNIRDTPFLDTWHNHPLYRQLRSGAVEQSCSGCHGKEHTRGGCRSTAYAFHGRWDAPDPFCTTLNQGVDLRVLPGRLL
jgi:radical SAM protein with 4Fe4S-binding SPASM domain